MSKKFYAKILTLALACTMVFAGMTATVSANGETEELFQSPNFSLNEEEKLTGWSFNGTIYGHVAEGGRGDNGHCLTTKVQQSSNSNAITQLVSGLTTGRVVEVSAYVKLINGSDLRFIGYPQKYDEEAKKFATVPSGYNGNIQVKGTADNAGQWVKVGFSVVLTEGATAFRLNIAERGTPGALIDDASLRYVDGDNLFLNHDFSEPASLDSTKALYWSGTGVTLENESLKITAGKSASFPTLYVYPGAMYKLSFRYKSDGGTPRVYMGSTPTKWGFNFQGAPNGTNEWVRYTCYITNRAYRVPQETVYISSLNADGYFDDVSLTIVENDKVFEVFNAEPKDLTAQDDAPVAFISYVHGESVATLPNPEENVYLLANVRDKDLAVGASEQKSVLVGIYKTVGTKKQLCGIEVKSINLKTINGGYVKDNNTAEAVHTSIVNVPGTAVIPMTMPSEAGAYTIEAFVWDSAAGLRPFGEPITVLSGSNAQ